MNVFKENWLKANSNEQRLIETIIDFKLKIDTNDIVIDKSGVKTVEILNYNVVLSPNQPELNFFDIRKTPTKYVNDEIDWYLTKDMKVPDVILKKAPVWRTVMSKQGLVNSNYGYLVYSDGNYKQYEHVLNELKNNSFSRRAMLVYIRPSIWEEYNQDGKNDFICTLGSQYFIRDNEFISIVNMRSNDFIFGFFNDFAWQCFVTKCLYEDLLVTYPNLKLGKLYWNANTMHVYERHFDMINNIYNTYYHG
jgi:thymidylate synthase